MKSQSSIYSDKKTGPSLVSILILAGLLVLPVMAVLRLRPYLIYTVVYILLLSVLTYWAYAHDKRSAREGNWRISEMHLHLLELLGGWPGAFVAQRRLRHKCSKGSYQFVFWMIIVLHQCVALDFVRHWQLSHSALKYIQNL